VYSNVVQDLSVPFCTGAVTSKVPAEGTLQLAQAYPHIAESYVKSSSDWQDTFSLHDSHRASVGAILENLRQLEWTRVAVAFPEHAGLAHFAIIDQSALVSGKDVVQHFVDHFHVK
jgi:hypothetical protein